MPVIREAIKVMDDGNPDKAILLLDSARKIGPPDYTYDYETGFAYQLKKDYKQAIRFFEASTKFSNATDQTFQMLGNIYDIDGDPKKAIETYKKGLIRFPNSGRLYLEYGIMDLIAKNYDEAVKKWEKGIEVEPDYPSNYYRLASLFSQTEHRIWAIFYGEMFLNLERNSERTQEISKLLFDMYKESITINADGAAKVDFTNSTLSSESNSFKNGKMPFRMAYGLDFILAMTLSSKGKEVTIDYIASARIGFIEHWFKQKRDKDYPNLLLNYQQKVKEAGYLEPYTYWLLMMGDENGFDKWYSKNEKKFKDFADWFNKNPLETDPAHVFIRPAD